MLSILIPSYNTQVTKLVRELKRQCEEAKLVYEILVLDDASTNEEIKAENKMLSSLDYCHFHENFKNLGRTASRNVLAEKARFEWLLFLDADVFPRNPDFIQRFHLNSNHEEKILLGGISYRDEIPKREEMLRWKYGRHREAKSVVERMKNPSIIVSGNLLITKSVFLQINSYDGNQYGLDILMSNEIRKNKVGVKHIENPVDHLGLEDSHTFLEKSINALHTTVDHVKRGDLPNDFRPVQKAYLTLKKMRLFGLFCFFMRGLLPSIERNLHSKRPNLFWFDLYRLYHYGNLIKMSNA